MKTIDIVAVRSMAAFAVVCLFALITAGCGGGGENMSPPTQTMTVSKAGSVGITTLNALLS